MGSLHIVQGQPNLGLISSKLANTRSFPWGGKVQLEHEGLLVSSVKRPVWSIKNIPLEARRPEDYLMETIFADLVHNNRVDIGGRITMHRIITATGVTALSTFDKLAVGQNAFTVTKTDQSIGSATPDVTTNEYTSAVGMGRAASVSGASSTPASLNAISSADTVTTFTVSGAGGTATGAALFDQIVVAGSHLYVEATFGSSALVVSGDSLQVTWTIQS
jgi:hypothetical protein